LLDAGRFDQADQQARRLLAATIAQHGSKSMQAAEVMDPIVEALCGRGKAKEAETRKWAKDVVRIKSSLVDSSDVRLAASLRNLGIVEELSGHFGTALRLYRRVLGIYERANDPRVAEIHNDLGIVLGRTGEYQEAIVRFEKALAILQSMPHPDELKIAFALNGLGIALFDFGDYAGARARYERSLDIRRRLLGPEHPKVAETENNLATLLLDVGDYEAADTLYAHVVSVRRIRYGERHPLVGRALTNLALVRLREAQPQSAREIYEQALTLLDEKLQGDTVAGSREGLGLAYRGLGQYPKAEVQLRKALDLREDLYGPDHPQVARSLYELASLLLEMGELETARPLCERALRIDRKSLGEDHPRVAEAEALRASILLGDGQRQSAFAAAIRAETEGCEHVRITSRSLSEREALLYTSRRAQGLDVALQIVAEEESFAEGAGSAAHPGAAKQAMAEVYADRVRVAWDTLVRSRALILDEMASRSQYAALSDDPAVSRRVGELRQAANRLANLSMRGPGNVESSAYRALVQSAQQQKEAAERALGASSPVFQQGMARSHIGLGDVAQSLPHGAALVAFATYDRLELPTKTHGSGGGDTFKKSETVTELLAFVLPPNGADPQVVRLGRARHIDSLITAWRRECAVGAKIMNRSRQESEKANRAAGEWVRRAVWDPLEPRVARASRVFMVPDRTLHLVNLEALPTGSDRYLIEAGPPLHILSAERDLVPVTTDVRIGRGLLAIGGVDYGSVARSKHTRGPSQGVSTLAGRQGGEERRELSRDVPPCADPKTVRFPYLPGTDREARNVASIWEHRPLGSAAAYDGQVGRSVPNRDALVLTGRQASEAAFKLEAPGRRVLHVATHGFFLGAGCGRRAPGSRAISVESTDRTNSVPLNPLLLTGLALAGVNDPDAAGADAEDGVLTGEEIAAMDLHGVEWAVLSACDTGVGTLYEGEGVLGLRRAFQLAGVRTSILSLWAVEDEPAEQWMSVLYEARLERGLATADAVHEAGLQILRTRRGTGVSTHPFYWASFVAAGEWR
jgi:CHAT domain-containing protein/tetratricopeptide (TPR) repeat protein